ncbi:hypothetical protein ERJ75_000648700 [Trypanosoma vivax]|nr:hypothetical protein ERJ75_000648700 [Trypanosoma vivax]
MRLYSSWYAAVAAPLRDRQVAFVAAPAVLVVARRRAIVFRHAPPRNTVFTVRGRRLIGMAERVSNAALTAKARRTRSGRMCLAVVRYLRVHLFSQNRAALLRRPCCVFALPDAAESKLPLPLAPLSGKRLESQPPQYGTPLVRVLGGTDNQGRSWLACPGPHHVSSHFCGER